MKKIIKPLLVLLVIAAAFCASFFGARLGTAPNTGTAETEKAEPLNAADSIALAGYDTLKLSAQQTEQSVYFYNPDRNKCFIVISVMCDGKELYTSPMIAPNTKIENISISEPLSVGIYDGIIKYSCFDLYTQRELNGAEAAVKLEVE